MMYILILILTTSNGGAATTSVEFNSKEACVAAAQYHINKFPYKLDSAVCFQKGVKQ